MAAVRAQMQEQPLCRLHDPTLESGGVSRAHADAVTRCRFSAESSAASGLRVHLATCSDTRLRDAAGRLAGGVSKDAPLRVWDAEHGALVATLRLPGVALVQDVAWDGTCRFLAAATFVPRVAVWSAATWALVHDIELPALAIAVAWQPAAPRLAVAMAAGAAEVLDLE